MATIEKAVRLVNPGKSRSPAKRRLTIMQKLHFGSKRQRSAAQATLSRKNPSFTKGKVSYNRKEKKSRTTIQKEYHQRRHFDRKAVWYNGIRMYKPDKRIKIPNVGEIITIHPLINSGYTKSSNSRKRKVNKGIKNPMAKTRKRRSISHVAAVKRARKAARTRANHRTRSNPSPVRRYHRRRATAVANPARRYHRRRKMSNPGRRRSYQRNPGMGGGMFKSSIGQAIGVIGGAFVTSLGFTAVSSMASSFVTPGIMTYLAIGVIAALQGQLIGKLLKNPALGKDMTVGGFVYLALKVAADMFPSVSLGISGGRGMGIIGPSSFWTPQVPMSGSMGTFVTPAGLMSALPPPAMAASSGPGMGNVSSIQRRGGRMR